MSEANSADAIPRSVWTPKTKPFPWLAIERMAGQLFRTLHEVNPFTLISVDDESVEVQLSTGELRRIARSTFTRTWGRLQIGAEVTRDDIDRIEDRQGTYVAAILARLSQVEYFTDPIRLYWRPSAEGLTEPLAKPEPGQPSEFLHRLQRSGDNPFSETVRRLVWEAIVEDWASFEDWESYEDLCQRMIDTPNIDLQRVGRRLRRDARAFRRDAGLS